MKQITLRGDNIPENVARYSLDYQAPNKLSILLKNQHSSRGCKVAGGQILRFNFARLNMEKCSLDQKF